MRNNSYPGPLSEVGPADFNDFHHSNGDFGGHQVFAREQIVQVTHLVAFQQHL